MSILINVFGGIEPRSPDHLLDATAATVAHNARLRNKRLEAWREPCLVATVPPSSVSFHMYGCMPLAWNSVVHTVDVSPDWGRIYLTGRTTVPEYGFVTASGMQYFPLGLPAPVSAPAMQFSQEDCQRDADARCYVYTYVNSWGEESAPSPASNVANIQDGKAVTISGLAVPPMGYDIRFIHIYRAATGYREIDGKQQKPLTGYLFVTRVEPPVTSFVDTVLLVNLQEPLTTEKGRMPPDGLTNIVGFENTIRLAGSDGNRIYLSELYQPHNWPARFDLALDHHVVHLGALGSTLFATTDAMPYVINTAGCDDAACMPVEPVGTPLPDVSCRYANSSVVTPHGFVYSSTIGAILLDVSGKYHVLTAKWFGEQDWKQLCPDTARFAYWQGFLFIITDVSSFVLNINGAVYDDMKGSELTTISDSPLALTCSNTGDLLLLQDNGIYAWDKGDVWRDYEWCSRELTGGGHQPGSQPPLGAAWSPSSVKIRTGDVQFTLHTSLPGVSFSRKVLDEQPFRVPRIGRHLWYKIRLQGHAPVEFVNLGTAYLTVNKGA